MGNDQECPGAFEHTTETLAKGLGVKRRKALVKDNEIGVLQQCAGDVEAAFLSVGELPACLADHL